MAEAGRAAHHGGRGGVQLPGPRTKVTLFPRSQFIPLSMSGPNSWMSQKSCPGLRAYGEFNYRSSLLLLKKIPLPALILL